MDDEIIPAGSDEEDKSDKGVSSDLIRGHINTIILRSLYDGDKYGYEIIAEIERKSSGQYSLKQPSLYSALKRLEKDGYITSYWGGSVGGGRRKYFSLTDEGKAVSEQNQAEWEYSRTIIDSLISDRDFDFNQPAPTPVDMRVLKRSTSRVPSSRDDEEPSEDFDFEPSFDDTALRDKLEEEYRNKEAALEKEYEEKRLALEEEYAKKNAELDAERADFEAEKAQLDAERTEREDALAEERNQLLKELEAEFQAKWDEREAELQSKREEQEAELQAKREEQEAELQVKREALEAELQAKREELETELQEKREEKVAEDETLKTELELQKKKYDEMCAAHEQELEASREAGRQALSEQREASEASLRVERELHAQALRELTEVHKQELKAASETAEQQREDALRTAKEESDEAFAEGIRKERERYDTLLAQERERHDTALAEERERHAAQIKDDRLRYEEALAEHDEALRQQMEYELREREREFKHRNYLSLVATPPAETAESRPEAVKDPPKGDESSSDYRSVVERLYDNAVRPTSSKPAEASEPTPVTGIDFRDIKSRASRDGLRVTTAGGAEIAPSSAAPDRENTVHRGKALFLSAIVAFFWCVIVGGIAMGLRDRLSIPVYYPCIMWALGFAALLVTGLLYANHYGENYLRRKVPVMVNAVVVYALLVIIALIIDLSFRAYTTTSEIMLFIGFPAIYFVGVLIFGVCYYLQTRSSKE